VSYQVPRKQSKKDDKKARVVMVRGRPVKKVPIVIKGLGTFYVQRKWVLLGALLAFVGFISLATFLYWLWEVRIPQITGG
jgi:hypothetical protein